MTMNNNSVPPPTSSTSYGSKLWQTPGSGFCHLPLYPKRIDTLRKQLSLKAHLFQVLLLNMLANKGGDRSPPAKTGSSACLHICSRALKETFHSHQHEGWACIMSKGLMTPHPPQCFIMTVLMGLKSATHGGWGSYHWHELKWERPVHRVHTG